MKERTILTYRDARKKALLRYFGDCDISISTQDFLQEKINYWQENEGITRTTCKNRLSLLISALSPYKSFGRFRYIQVEKDGQEKKIYSEQDIKKIVGYCYQHPTMSYIPTMLAIFTGLRLTEICGLKWEEVDLNEKTVAVRRNAFTYKKQAYISTPKTRNGARIVPMPEMLCKWLLYFGDRREYLYVASGKEIPRKQRSIQRSNELLCAKVGVVNCGMHAYRHVFASKLLQESTDFKAIADIMGHSNIDITQKVYNHTRQSTRNDIVSKAFEEKAEEPKGDLQAQLDELKEKYDKMRKRVIRMWRWYKEQIGV